MRATILATLGVLAAAAQAQADDWKLEMTPYLWAVGTDADVTFDSRTARVKREFEDVDLGGSVLGVAQVNRFVAWTQLDLLSLDTNELDQTPAGGRLETDAFLGTLGYRRVYYDIRSKDGRSHWDAAFQGTVFGIGGTFGRDDRSSIRR